MGADSHLLSRAKGPRLTQDLHVAYVMVRLRWSGAVDSVAWIDCGHWAVGPSDRLERRVSPRRLREELRRRMAEPEGGQGQAWRTCREIGWLQRRVSVPGPDANGVGRQG